MSSAGTTGELEHSLNHSRSRSVPTLRELGEAKRTTSIPLNTGRTSGRHVTLGPGWDFSGRATEDNVSDVEPERAEVVPVQYQGLGLQERVRCYCVAASFDRVQLQEEILKRTNSLHAYPEVLSSSYHRAGRNTQGQIFYFDFGCVVFWGLDAVVERHVLKQIVAPCMVNPVPSLRAEKDRLSVQYTNNPKHYIYDDSLALHYRFAEDLQVKLAISFALAQSTKLSVFEERMRDTGKRLAYLPVMMAESGTINVTERQIMRYFGQLFLQMSAVNLLERVLDTPEAMTAASDHISTLYKSVYDYMEIVERVHLLNDRYAVLQEMLDMLRVHAQKEYSAILLAIVMWLVGLGALVGLLQLYFFAQWTPSWRQ